MPHPLERTDFYFSIEVWAPDESAPIEVLARLANAVMAQAAFKAACQIRPNDTILLCAKGLIMERYRPTDSGPNSQPTDA